MKKAILAVSGGMDSTSLMIHLLSKGYEVNALSFDYGQKHRVELDRLSDNIRYIQEQRKGAGPWFPPLHHNVVDLSILGSLFSSALLNKGDNQGKDIPEGHYAQENMKQTVVPNRNMIFASILQGYALSISLRDNTDTIIAMGVHSGDHAIYPDCTPEFRNAVMLAFQVGNWESERVASYYPYMNGDKYTILQDAVISCNGLGLGFDRVLGNTNTCYNPDIHAEACGRCGSCIERIEAFIKLGRPDPAFYQGSWEFVVKHAKKVLKNAK